MAQVHPSFSPYSVQVRTATNVYVELSAVLCVKACTPIGQEGGGKLSSEEEAIIWTAASLYGAAADTTVITLTAFILAMIRFPKVQERAQDEIDRVVWTDRLPSHDDREKLSYINALVKEAIRWWPIAPMGFPHTATEDIQYDGFLIAKGAYLLPAVWWFARSRSLRGSRVI